MYSGTVRPAVRRASLAAAVVAGGAVSLAALAADGPGTPQPNTPDQRVGIVGDFLWARACDIYEDVAFGPTPRDLVFAFEPGDALKRSNLTGLDPRIACTVQPTSLRLDTTGAHNAKLMLGYMPTGWRFTHGDNCDLVHWAARDRVVLFIPIRHAAGADPERPESYFLSPYAAQAVSVVELKAGELIRYEWYRGGPGKLDPHVLMDLYPFCGGERDLAPAVNRPIFKFEVFGGGRWKVSIERDGRDGLAGGETDGDFDLVFTDRSPGAKPYSVDLGEETAFGCSVYCPSGRPNLGARIGLRLEPFDRRTGRPVPPSGDRTFVRDVRLGDVAKLLRLVRPETGRRVADLSGRLGGALPNTLRRTSGGPQPRVLPISNAVPTTSPTP